MQGPVGPAGYASVWSGGREGWVTGMRRGGMGEGGRKGGRGGTTGRVPQAGPTGARRARTGWSGGGGGERRARKRWIARISAFSGEPALRWPKCAAAKRPTKPSMQKPLMALSQRPRQEEGSQPMTRRHRRTTWPCSSMVNTHDQNGLPVQPAKMLRWYASSRSSANMMSQASRRAAS